MFRTGSAGYTLPKLSMILFKRQYCLVAKARDCESGDLDCVPRCANDLLCDLRQAVSLNTFKRGHRFCVPQFSVAQLKVTWA